MCSVIFVLVLILVQKLHLAGFVHFLFPLTFFATATNIFPDPLLLVPEVGVLELGVLEVGVLEVHLLEIGVLEVGVLEGGALEVGALEVGALEEVGVLEIGAFEVRNCDRKGDQLTDSPASSKLWFRMLLEIAGGKKQKVKLGQEFGESIEILKLAV